MTCPSSREGPDGLLLAHTPSLQAAASHGLREALMSVVHLGPVRAPQEQPPTFTVKSGPLVMLSVTIL